MKTFILCDSATENTYGFRIDLNGMDLGRFYENPVMLYGHASSYVIGRWKNVRIEEGQLKAEPDFDMDDAEAAKIAKKVEKGYLKGASVGIIIKKMEADEETGKRKATKTELLEASIVAVPSDKNALALYSDNFTRLSATDVEQYLSVNINNLNDSKMDDKQKIQQLEADAAANAAKIAALEKEKAELAAAAAKAETEKHEAWLSAAEQAGKITASEKAQFAKLAALDFETVKQTIELRKPAKEVSLSAMAGRRAAPETSLAAEWDALDKSGKLFALKANAPERYSELYAAKFGKS
jgi:HK97 family phage prohead protease